MKNAAHGKRVERTGKRHVLREEVEVGKCLNPAEKRKQHNKNKRGKDNNRERMNADENEAVAHGGHRLVKRDENAVRHHEQHIQRHKEAEKTTRRREKRVNDDGQGECSDNRANNGQHVTDAQRPHSPRNIIRSRLAVDPHGSHRGICALRLHRFHRRS